MFKQWFCQSIHELYHTKITHTINSVVFHSQQFDNVSLSVLRYITLWKPVKAGLAYCGISFLSLDLTYYLFSFFSNGEYFRNLVQRQYSMRWSIAPLCWFFSLLSLCPILFSFHFILKQWVWPGLRKLLPMGQTYFFMF